MTTLTTFAFSTTRLMLRKTSIRLFSGVSKDTSSSSRSTTKTSKSIIRPNKLLSSLVDKIDSNIDTTVHKTGAQLRKEVRAQLTKQRAKATQQYKIEKQKRKQKSGGVSNVRFRLGNGVEAISSNVLIELVKSTAPYYFSTHKHASKSDVNINSININDETAALKKNTNTYELTEPYLNISLEELSSRKNGWLYILNSKYSSPNLSSSADERINYFALMIACHFASVATYVPTDVDSKIRGHCWLVC
jgi:hypothetical protein